MKLLDDERWGLRSYEEVQEQVNTITLTLIY